jgi:hypothetical protein
MTPLLGFMPDADGTTPGVISDCTNFIPYLNGMMGAPTPVTPAATPVLASECIGAAVTTNLAGFRRIFAGAETKVYELSGGAWVDRSRASPYTSAGDNRWSFAQFGDATLAANRSDTIQRSTTGAFADIASAPKAEIIFSVGAFVMALNTNDGTEKPDGWHCCAIFEDTDWTPSILTQAARGRLVASPGAITAGARMGEYAVAYKAKSIFLGQYVGAPSVWDWIPVAGGEAGCVGKEALCDLGGAHFFVGEDNFYVFDGTRPAPVADNAVRQWFFDNSNPQFRYRTKCVFDRQNSQVWIFYPGNGSAICNQALVYHVQGKKWGRATLDVQAVLYYTAPGLTIDDLSTLSASTDGLPSISYDSQFWLSGGRALSAFNASNQLQMLTGDSASSSFTTGDVGDDDAVSLLTQIRLRYAQAPATATATVSRTMTSGTGYTAGVSGSVNDGKFDVLQSSRWHKARFDFTGPVRVTAMNAQIKPAGQR